MLLYTHGTCIIPTYFFQDHAECFLAIVTKPSYEKYMWIWDTSMSSESYEKIVKNKRNRKIIEFTDFS